MPTHVFPASGGSSAAHAALLALAQRLCTAYVRLPGVRAVAVIGSAAAGRCDYYSDLDFAVYYDSVPDEAELARTRGALGGAEWRMLGERTAQAHAEAFVLDGVQCQVVHQTVGHWEHELARVLEQHDTDKYAQKAVSGILGAVPLFGAELIGRWQARARRYPPALGRAMVEQHLHFFPLWGLTDYLQTRDATIWRMEMMVEAAHNMLGVLAGLNGVYFSSFQLKRTRQLVDQLPIAPPRLYQRIQRLFDPKLRVATATLEQLAGEVVELVEQHMPGVDTSAARGRLGWRQAAWGPEQLT